MLERRAQAGPDDVGQAGEERDALRGRCRVGVQHAQSAQGTVRVHRFYAASLPEAVPY